MTKKMAFTRQKTANISWNSKYNPEKSQALERVLFSCPKIKAPTNVFV